MDWKCFPVPWWETVGWLFKILIFLNTLILSVLWSEYKCVSFCPFMCLCGSLLPPEVNRSILKSAPSLRTSWCHYEITLSPQHYVHSLLSSTMLSYTQCEVVFMTGPVVSSCGHIANYNSQFCFTNPYSSCFIGGLMNGNQSMIRLSSV